MIKGCLLVYDNEMIMIVIMIWGLETLPRKSKKISNLSILGDFFWEILY
jgi:hypothetical protein